jgi:hypothetical protein
MSKPLPKTELPQKMNWKDRISLIISAIALVISAITSYQAFKDGTELNAAILGVSLGDRETSVSVAIMNTGNRYVALT